jgi:hypothetical protein
MSLPHMSLSQMSNKKNRKWAGSSFQGTGAISVGIRQTIKGL